MTYSILGAGAVGQALAKAFARKGMDVGIASRRSPEDLRPVAKALGPTVLPMTLQEALEADVLLLAVPFWQHKEVAKALGSWHEKLIIDATNAYGVAPEELGDLPSSAVIAQALPGAKLVKAFNHLPAHLLAQDPAVAGGRRVLFLASDDEAAASQVATIVEALGYAPVALGKLAEGGLLVQAKGPVWAQLIFQDLAKKGA